MIRYVSNVCQENGHLIVTYSFMDPTSGDVVFTETVVLS